MYKGKEAKLFVKTDAQAFVDDPKLLEIKSGDVVRIAQDATGMVVNLFKVYTLYQDAEWLDGILPRTHAEVFGRLGFEKHDYRTNYIEVYWHEKD